MVVLPVRQSRGAFTTTDVAVRYRCGRRIPAGEWFSMRQRLPITIVLVLAVGGTLVAEERFESFDRNPRWDASNNRPSIGVRKLIRQDFGFSLTHRARGKRPGELGGFVNPSAEPAYYAKRIPTRTFEHRLTASGTVNCTGRQFHVLLGFFNSDTLNAVSYTHLTLPTILLV